MLQRYARAGGAEGRYLAAWPQTSLLAPAGDAARSLVPAGRTLLCVFEPRAFWIGRRVSVSLMHDRSVLERAAELSFTAADLRRRLTRAHGVRWVLVAPPPPSQRCQYLGFMTERQRTLINETLNTRVAVRWAAEGNPYRLLELSPPP